MKSSLAELRKRPRRDDVRASKRYLQDTISSSLKKVFQESRKVKPKKYSKVKEVRNSIIKLENASMPQQLCCPLHSSQDIDFRQQGQKIVSESTISRPQYELTPLQFQHPFEPYEDVAVGQKRKIEQQEDASTPLQVRRPFQPILKAHEDIVGVPKIHIKSRKIVKDAALQAGEEHISREDHRNENYPLHTLNELRERVRMSSEEVFSIELSQSVRMRSQLKEIRMNKREIINFRKQIKFLEVSQADEITHYENLMKEEKCKIDMAAAESRIQYSEAIAKNKVKCESLGEDIKKERMMLRELRVRYDSSRELY